MSTVFSEEDLKILDAKDVWVAWTNTDLTEGRGHQIPRVVCASETTAIRLGKKGYVMGTDCPVTKSIAVRLKGTGWLLPGRIIEPSAEDLLQDAAREELRAIEDKARAAGLTDDDIKALRGQA